MGIQSSLKLLLRIMVGVVLAIAGALVILELRFPISDPPKEQTGIVLQAHKPLGYLPCLHLSLKIVPTHQALWMRKRPDLFVNHDSSGYFYCTISAGPVNDVLVAGVNRSKDLTIKKRYYSELTWPNTITEDDEISRVLELWMGYTNRAPFGLLPSIEKGTYNCNSFIASVLSFGLLGTRQVLSDNIFPGIGNKIPKRFFEQSAMLKGSPFGHEAHE